MAATTTPRATARLQFHHGFTLDDAVPVVPYLANLGISHLYASPILTARAGSMHGYDVVDPTRINPELGGEPALRRLVAALRAHGMGLIVDIVPNHMGVGGNDNAWWLDLLEWGRASQYAEFFDVDWDPPDASLRGKVLVPFLGEPYGDCLASGDLALRFDASDGRFFVGYHDHRLPITPRLQTLLLEGAPEVLRPAANDFAGIGSILGGRAATRRAAAHARAGLAEIAATPAGRAAIDTVLAAFDTRTDAGRNRLHALLERQHYRVAWWRAAADEINWRRFFDINTLAGLRTELPAVFDATHALILRLYSEGLIDGLRIDHVDGLADPRGYCRKLRRTMEAAASARPPDAPPGAPYIVVEKILAMGERLPADWQTDGTTGYDFMNQVSAVLHDPAGEAPLTALWVELTGRPGRFEDEERPARLQILRDNLSSELHATAAALHRIARRDLATRDYTLTGVRNVLTALLVQFPVYRLYAGKAGRSETDDHVLARAMSPARRALRPADRPLLDLLGGWLGGEAPRALPPGPARQERQRAVVRFQQLTSPLAAKSVEDTAFYRFGRLLSRNEVGSNPDLFAMTPSAFHASCRERGRLLPDALLAIATHDHKRGADLRMRLAVLGEMADDWGALVRRWMRLNALLHQDTDAGASPRPADEIMLYQMLVAAWPPGLRAEDSEGVQALAERLAAWQEKALREAKLHTEWAAPDAGYESACRSFLFRVLEPSRPARVVDEIAEFASRIAPAGAINGLSQALLWLTAPGVPDLYQGDEFWDLSLVDPDNRRPVDFAARQSALIGDAAPASLLADWQDGRVKQAIVHRALALRAREPALFARGRYLPLQATGPAAEHLLAFAREHEGRRAITIVTRLAVPLLGAAILPLVPATSWQGTELLVPRQWSGQSCRDVLDGQDPIRLAQRLQMGTVMARLPVALLEVG